MRQQTALYRYYDADNVLLYIGVSLSAVHRLQQHRNTQHWSHRITRVDISYFPSREDALKAEREAIRAENPLHNVIHRVMGDDVSAGGIDPWDVVCWLEARPRVYRKVREDMLFRESLRDWRPPQNDSEWHAFRLWIEEDKDARGCILLMVQDLEHLEHREREMQEAA